jgi:hypothetical protein
MIADGRGLTRAKKGWDWKPGVEIGQDEAKLHAHHHRWLRKISLELPFRLRSPSPGA